MELQELVSMPISLKLETIIDGTKFYSSDSLKQKFIMAFEKSSKGKNVSNEIRSLVQKNLILPCYKSKNLFSFIKKKLSSNVEKYILGFYHIDEKKVIVLIENSISIIGTAANNDLASTTIHECMHLIAGRNLSKFIQVFIRYLRSYYSEFIKDYFKVENVSQKKIDEMIKYIIRFERKGFRYANKELGNYFRLIESLFKNDTLLEAQDFQSRLTSMIIALKLFIVHMPSLMKNSRQYSMLFTSLNQAYFNAFRKKNDYTTPIQELISVSEIACVFSEMDPQNSVIKRLFKILT